MLGISSLSIVELLHHHSPSPGPWGVESPSQVENNYKKIAIVRNYLKFHEFYSMDITLILTRSCSISFDTNKINKLKVPSTGHRGCNTSPSFTKGKTQSRILHRDSGVVQRPRQPGAHCSLLPINQTPALREERVLTFGVVLPPHESRIRKFFL